MQHITPEDLLTVQEAALALNRSVEAVRQLIKTGSLEALKIKHAVFVERRALNRYKQRAGLN